MDDLRVGTPGSIQNQTGNHSNKWDKTGIVLENKPHLQVVIRVDGSRRVTTRNRRFVRPLNPVLRMEANPKPVMRKKKKSNPVMRKEKKREVPVHKAPVHEASIHEAPSVDGDLDTPRDLQVGADDRHVPTGEVVHKKPDRRPDVIEAPLEAAQHIPDPVQLVEKGSRPKRSPKPNKKYSLEMYDLFYVGKR